MEISVGLYALILIFFFLIIPGYIARRSYCNGEFSKQVNWSTKVLTNFTSSLFVGILITLTFIFIFNLFSRVAINIDEILNKFDSDFISAENSASHEKFTGFTSNAYHTYLPFICSVYLFATITGFFMNRIVLSFGLDLRFKLLKFTNNWHYLFSGKILQLKKDSSNTNLGNKAKYTYLDVLVAEESPKLYSGLFANYDVSFDNINKLEKVYLYNTTRYKKTETGYIPVIIPGNIFTIMGDKILNINCTYVYFDDDEIRDKKFKIQKRILVSFQILTVLFFSFICISLIFSFHVINSYTYSLILQKAFIEKILIIFVLNFLLGLVTPFKVNQSAKKVSFIGWDVYFSRILISIFLIAIALMWW